MLTHDAMLLLFVLLCFYLIHFDHLICFYVLYFFEPSGYRCQ